MTKTPNPLTEALLETADGTHRIGVMDDATHRQITARHLGDHVLSAAEPITGGEIRSLRERGEQGIRTP